ncbi:c-type cytochrome [Christiangramia sp. SM2212]|uniref:C-type cytochrome n=1 Tax=Christiangramia sediminicola TaxID=3073267 RepID=A0ABU1EN83_9FLAO|nr:c-type cytochrome [Christiangramia sp. SM2212]MDR5589806.1 c-type cytochrome [Christiangramia sp. SM2212]
MNFRSFKKQSFRNQLIILIGFLIVLLIIIYLLFQHNIFHYEDDYVELKDPVKVDPLKADYDIFQLDDSEENLHIKYGFELFINTAQYIGPENGDPEMKYSGNNLSCTNCHLNAGTKPYSGMLIGVINRFPQFRGRENKIGSIEERINGCMERSMNGRVLPVSGNEMKAFVAYMNWLNRFAPEDGKIKGVGYANVKIPNRRVNLEEGKTLFAEKCASCHGENGQGVALREYKGYLYPPLWGDDSYNNGAGMTRVITAAEFIKANMPYGATFEEPELTDEESYDLAGYINSHARPLKPNPERDFPDLTKKPVSTPYPPYADNFPIQQHQMGPFQEIMEFYKAEYGMVKTK